MTQDIPKGWLEDWRQSMCDFETPAQTMDRLDTVSHKYIREIGRGTGKARFFCTRVQVNEEYGFWCPRSAIVSDGNNVLQVEKWVKLQTIKYNR